MFEVANIQAYPTPTTWDHTMVVPASTPFFGDEVRKFNVDQTPFDEE